MKKLKKSTQEKQVDNMWSKEKTKEWKELGSIGKVKKRRLMKPVEKFFKFPTNKDNKND